MNAILNRLQRLSDDELLSVSEAIDIELELRLERQEEIPDSARRRAVQRQKSYRHSLGSAALPVKVTGMKDSRRRRLAA
jgi:ribosomal protein S13